MLVSSACYSSQCHQISYKLVCFREDGHKGVNAWYLENVSSHHAHITRTKYIFCSLLPQLGFSSYIMVSGHYGRYLAHCTTKNIEAKALSPNNWGGKKLVSFTTASRLNSTHSFCLKRSNINEQFHH